MQLLSSVDFAVDQVASNVSIDLLLHKFINICSQKFLVITSRLQGFLGQFTLLKLFFRSRRGQLLLRRRFLFTLLGLRLRLSFRLLNSGLFPFKFQFDIDVFLLHLFKFFIRYDPTIKLPLQLLLQVQLHLLLLQIRLMFSITLLRADVIGLLLTFAGIHVPLPLLFSLTLPLLPDLVYNLLRLQHAIPLLLVAVRPNLFHLVNQSPEEVIFLGFDRRPLSPVASFALLNLFADNGVFCLLVLSIDLLLIDFEYFAWRLYEVVSLLVRNHVAHRHLLLAILGRALRTWIEVDCILSHLGGSCA